MSGIVAHMLIHTHKSPALRSSTAQTADGIFIMRAFSLTLRAKLRTRVVIPRAHLRGPKASGFTPGTIPLPDVPFKKFDREIINVKRMRSYMYQKENISNYGDKLWY